VEKDCPALTSPCARQVLLPAGVPFLRESASRHLSRSRVECLRGGALFPLSNPSWCRKSRLISPPPAFASAASACASACAASACASACAASATIDCTRSAHQKRTRAKREDGEQHAHARHSPETVVWRRKDLNPSAPHDPSQFGGALAGACLERATRPDGVSAKWLRRRRRATSQAQQARPMRSSRSRSATSCCVRRRWGVQVDPGFS